MNKGLKYTLITLGVIGTGVITTQEEDYLEEVMIGP